MLPTRGPQAYGSFTHALSRDGYTHISELLTGALSQSEDRTNKERRKLIKTTCDGCFKYLPTNVMDPELDKLLEKHCCLLIDNIEPRDITDYPYQVGTTIFLSFFF